MGTPDTKDASLSLKSTIPLPTLSVWVSEKVDKSFTPTPLAQSLVATLIVYAVEGCIFTLKVDPAVLLPAALLK